MSYIGHMFLNDNLKIDIEKQILITLWYIVNNETYRWV